MASSHVKYATDAIKPCAYETCSSHQEGLPGVRTDNNLKYRYAMNLKRLLAEQKLAIAADLCSANAEEVISILKHELMNYKQKVIEPSDSSTAAPRLRFSGKEGNGKDDVVMALQFMYWPELMKKRPAFQRSCQAQGYRFESE